nr:RNA-directed DNA polymerase, eukaryota, reverse transcriptase zinc-binding domain protein [Tanacetum cinerariifolium]
MWDPAMFSKENIWCNDNYVIVSLINIYGPQDPLAKATLWSSLLSFAQHHQGRYVLFGDLNEVRDEDEQFGTSFSKSGAQVFNKFVADSGLPEMMMDGKSFTWMNKLGTKMSKLDRFLLSEEVLDDNHNLNAIVLERLWSDHSPSLLHTLKTDYGSIPFKFFHSWFHRKDIDVVVKQAFVDTPQAATGSNVYLHEKLKFIKYRLKNWNSELKKEVNRKKEAIALLQDINHKVDFSMAFDSEKEIQLQLLHEIHNIDRMESMDLFQKARIKWDIEGDENTKFFLSLIKQNRRRQAIQWIMVDGTWVSNPVQVKEAFLDFYKEKFQSHVPQDDIEPFVSDFFATARLPPGINSSFITFIPKVSNHMFIKDYRIISLIGLQYKIIAKNLANRLARVVNSLISLEQSAFISDLQILDGPLMLSEIMECPTSEFSIKRGLRQGDQLSPFLFILIMEGFHIAIKDATRSNLIKGVTVGNPGMRLSHFFYVDDVVFVTEWNQVDMDNVIRLQNGAGLTHFDCKSKGVWANIINIINHLHSKNIISSNTLSYKVGCGSQVRFWIDNWTGDSSLYPRYHRLYLLETHPNCSVSDRFSSGEWAWHWSRPITLGRCLDVIHSLKVDLHSLSLSTDKDVLRWSPTHDGSFTVGATRKYIGDVILLTLSMETSWCNLLPRKVRLRFTLVSTHLAWERHLSNKF